MGLRRTFWAVLLISIGMAIAVACATPAAPATQLEVTTIQTICGGTIPPPGQPFCRSNPSPRTVQVNSGRTVIASGTSGVDGKLIVQVPAGLLAVSVPGAQPYENCDTPAVTAVDGQTTPVTQTCTINAP